MAVPDLWVSSDVRAQLGGAGVDTVADSLYPRDCQSCGLPLKAKPALVVDDIGDTVIASLHHRNCRRSQWDRSGVVSAGFTSPNLTYTAEIVLLPTRIGGVPGGTEAILVLNPALESVFIERDPIGQWHIEMPLAFSATGFCPPGPGLDLTVPVDGAIAKLGCRSIVVITTGLMSHHFELSATDELLRSIRVAGGVLVAVTHAIDPSRITRHDDLQPVLAGDRTAMGLVAVQH